ncbi:MAG: formyltransferase family protein [Microthrixaceae bacterium]
MPRLAVAGAKTTTLEMLQSLERLGVRVDVLLTLRASQAAEAQVAGFTDLVPYATDHGIEVHHPSTYALGTDEDRARIGALGLDCLLVIGWQRLIPAWLLESLRCGAYGMHGSAEPLPRGRGRSPMNWALAEGREGFLTHLFRYDAGVDSGAVVGRHRFDITVWDDCETLHFKNRMAMSRLLATHLPAILDGTVTPVPQRGDVEPTYLDKRTPEDGRILWTEHSMRSLYNHVRAQTRPFPGAFSHLRGRPERTHFWRVQPFDTHLTDLDAYPGTVVESFYDGSFLVTTWDGSVLVRDFESGGGPTPRIGDVFEDHPR